MSRFTRLGLAVLLLSAFLTIPLWLPRLLAAGFSTRPQAPLGDDGSAQLSTGAGDGAPPDTDESDQLDPGVTLIDAGWVTGAGASQERTVSRSVLHWTPGRGSVDWRLETGQIWGSYQDDQRRIYLTGQDKLTILDAETGTILRDYSLDASMQRGPNAGFPFPVGRHADTLFLRNRALDGNLFAFDLDSGAVSSVAWDVCEHGNPFDSVFLAEEDAMVTFCLEFSENVRGYLTRVELNDRTSATVDLPPLGDEEYMVGNGFAVSPDGAAYVLDSDAGSIVEIDLGKMQIARQVSYAGASGSATLLQRLLARVIDLGASSAEAKRWMSFPTISPDGRLLVVDGGFIEGNGSTRTAVLVDLQTLQSVGGIDLPRSPRAFRFVDNSTLYILLEADSPGTTQIISYDIRTGTSTVFNPPAPGRVEGMVP